MGAYVQILQILRKKFSPQICRSVYNGEAYIEKLAVKCASACIEKLAASAYIGKLAASAKKIWHALSSDSSTLHRYHENSRQRLSPWLSAGYTHSCSADEQRA